MIHPISSQQPHFIATIGLPYQITSHPLVVSGCGWTPPATPSVLITSLCHYTSIPHPPSSRTTYCHPYIRGGWCERWPHPTHIACTLSLACSHSSFPLILAIVCLAPRALLMPCCDWDLNPHYLSLYINTQRCFTRQCWLENTTTTPVALHLENLAMIME